MLLRSGMGHYRVMRHRVVLSLLAIVVMLGFAMWAVIVTRMAGAAGTTPTVRGATSATVRYNTDPKTIAAPTIVAGDLLVMIYVTDNVSVTDMQLPSGFTERSRREFGLNSNHMIIATKVATASEPSSYTYVAPSGADTRVDLISVADADPNAVPVIVTSETVASTTTHAAPSVSPAGTSDLLISGVTLMSNPSNPGATTWTAPSGMTEVTDAQTSTILTLTTARQALTGGASGTKTFTATAGTAVKGMAFSIAINAVGDEPGARPPATTPTVRDVVVETDGWQDEAMTVARPTVEAGDLLVMNFLADWGTIDEMIVPSGFKVQYRLDRGVDKNHMVVATKVATASEPTSYSYSANTAADTRVDLFSIKDADTLAPLVGAGVTTSTSVNYLVAPSLTPLGIRDLLLSSANFVHYPDPGVVTWTAPFGMTEKSDARTQNLSMTSAVEPLGDGGPTGARTFLGAPQTPQPGDAFSVAIKGRAGNTAQVMPDGMTGGWTSGTYTDIDEGEAVNGADYLRASGTTTSTATFSMQTAANIAQATSITVHVCAYSATNANGGTLDTVTNNIAGVGGTPTAFTTTPPYSAAGTCKWEQQTYYGTWTQAQIDALQLTFARALQGTGSNAAKADDVRIVSAYATVVYSSTPTVSQAAYRWFANDTSTSVGAPLAAANTVANTPSGGNPMRLRLNLGVVTGDLMDGTSYKLRYQAKSGSCSTNPALYADVTTSTPIKFHDNTAVENTASYVASASDPNRSGVTPIGQTYQEANNFTVVTPVLKGQDGLWDFVLNIDTNTAIGTYCLMATKTDGTAIGSYAVIPEITVPAPVYEQSSYRFYQNSNSSFFPGSALAAQNTSIIVRPGDAFRLRQLLRQTDGGQTTTSRTFKLEMGEKLTTCAAASYSDAIAVFTDNPTPSDEASILTSASDPTPASGSVVAQRYSENASISVQTAMQVGDNGLWDFSLASSAAWEGKTYCYRIVNSDNTVVGAYAQYPEVTFVTPQFEQSSYRFSQNDNSSTLTGNPFANTNTPATVITNQPYRLRLLLRQTVGSATVGATVKLQIGQKVTTCAAASYGDATKFMDNSSPSDGVSIVAVAYSDPVAASGAVVPQSYNEDAVLNVRTVITTGDNGLWDVALSSDRTMTGKTYCFRVVNSDNSVLSSYAQYPEITIGNPTTSQQMRGGQGTWKGHKFPLNW